MIHSAYIFRSAQEIEGLFDTFFNGFFFVKGLPLFFQIAVMALYPIACAFAYFETLEKKKIFGVGARVCAVLSFVLVSVLVFQPCDELFVNLKHSLNLAEVGKFSFSQVHAIEGTVDFLPYFMIGLLGKMGLPLVELSFLLSLFGGVLCILALSRILEKFQVPFGRTWGKVFFCCYAPLCFNSSHGFATTLFAAAILWSFYLFCMTPHKVWGLSVAALIPLIRVEGIWFLVLFFVGFVLPQFRKRFSSVLLAAGGLFLPFLFLSLFRYHRFGSAIPSPVLYKSAIGNLFFFLIGLRNLVADLIANYGFFAMAVICLMLRLVPKRERNALSPLFLLLVILVLFTLPYYLSGGDWFPAAWGRYMLPFSLAVSCTSIIAGQRLIPVIFEKFSLKQLIGPFFLSLPLITAAITFGSYSRLLEDVFAARKTLANINFSKSARTSFRVHYLSQLGNHLGKTTSANTVIGSSEIATIMYFAKREAFDFLGITNPEIIDEPLRSPKLYRRAPKDNELPYLIFKRVKPETLAKYRPPILYTFDFIPSDLASYISFSELNDEKIFEIVNRWEIKFRGLLQPVYGGLGNILKLGYRPFIVLYDNHFASMYFVASEAVGEHLAFMKKEGLEGGLVEKRVR